MTGDSLPSSPSLTSLDKISTTSNHSVFYRQHFQDQQSIPEKVKIFHSVFFGNDEYLFQDPHANHSRSSSASSFLASSNGSSSQGYASATASPTIGTGNPLVNLNENETIIAKVQLAGNDDLLYKKVRVSS